MSASSLAAGETRTHADVTSASAQSGATPVLARIPVSVRWGDLDAFNHVNNAAFLEYVQEARLVWMTRLGGEWLDDSMMPVVAAAHVNFRSQLTWPADVLVELVVGRVGRSSVTLAHRITSSTDSAHVFADGDTVLVWIDRASGRSIPLPDAIRAACQSPPASAATTSK